MKRSLIVLLEQSRAEGCPRCLGRTQHLSQGVSVSASERSRFDRDVTSVRALMEANWVLGQRFGTAVCVAQEQTGQACLDTIIQRRAGRAEASTV